MNEEVDENTDELNELLDGLETFKPVNTLSVSLSDCNINEFIMNTAGAIASNGAAAISDLKRSVGQSSDPDEIAALSELMKATTNALNTLNRINIQNKKAAASKDLKKMDMEHQLKLPVGDNNTTNNILIASREDILKKYLPEESGKIVDVEVVEKSEKPE